MLGNQPTIVTRVPHFTATSDVESFSVKGVGRECFGQTQVWHDNKHYFRDHVKVVNRRVNYYDGKSDFNGVISSPLYRGRLTVQYRANTSGWLSFSYQDETGRDFFFAYAPDAIVSCTYRENGVLKVWEGSFIEFFKS